jgi:hypothetical protein
MFRRKALPKPPKLQFPSTLAELNYAFNEEGKLRNTLTGRLIFCFFSYDTYML